MPKATEDAALPEPGAFDAHTHMDIMGLPVDGILAAARAVGIKRVVNVGCDLASSRWATSSAAEYPDVYAAVAIHPNETGAVYAEREPVLAAITALAESPKVVAIGETGLDYYRDYSARDVQQAWFRAHIELARRTGKTLMIHDRDAHDDVLAILAEYAPWPPYSVIFHCFSGDAAMAERCAREGYVMSFAGNVTFKNAVPLQEAALAANIPIAACSLGSRDTKRLEAYTASGRLLNRRNASIFAENVQETIEAMTPLGVSTFITTSGLELPDVPRADQRDALIEALRTAAPIAEKAGVTIVLEPLNLLVDHQGTYLSSSHEAAEILTEVHSPNVKMLFDIYHQQITEGHIIANLLAYMPLIGHIHTADNPGRHEFGTGEINYTQVLQAVDESGYTGYVGLEYKPTCATARSLAGVYDALR